MNHTPTKAEQESFSSADRFQMSPRSQLLGPVDWMRLREIDLDRQKLVRNHIVALDRRPGHAAINILRTRLLQDLKANKWVSVAITSPTPACGKTVTAVNLACSLSHQRDRRTMLIDLNMRNPRIGSLLDATGSVCISDFLSGKAQIRDVLRRHGQNLAIGATRKASFSAELLQTEAACANLREMQSRFSPDVILYDMPSLMETDDVTAFLPNVDCALLVVEAERSTFDEIDQCVRHLAERTNLLGVVLNRCRYGGDF